MPVPLYQDPYASQTIDLIQARARAQADAARQIAAYQAKAAETIGGAQANAQVVSGQAWGNAANQIGQIPQTVLAFQDQALKRQALQSEIADRQQRTSDMQALDKAWQQPGGRDAVINAIPGHLRPAVMESLNKADESGAKVKEANIAAENATTGYVTDLAEGVKAHSYSPEAAQIAISHAKDIFSTNPSMMQQLGQIEQAIHANPTPEAVQGLIDPILTAKEAKEKPIAVGREGSLVTPAGKVLVAPTVPSSFESKPMLLDGQPVNVSFDKTSGKSIYNGEDVTGRVAPITPQKSLQSKSVLVDGKPAEASYNPVDGTYSVGGQAVDASRVKPIPPASTIINPQSASDVKESVAAMKEGSAPPLLPGRATKEYLATIAEAHRQGFDLAKANEDWVATNAHIKTLNGAQQTRLRQSINTLPELLDSVDQLASQWKGGRFPVLNKVNLAAAKNGVYGSDVASVANKLDAQIADVTADLGNVYMGGNSPTDHALGLASKSLDGAWDEKVLHDMVDLARKNVTIRQNSIKNTGVAGASDTNPYAPQQTAPAAAPVIWERGPDGKPRKVGG